MFKENSDKQVPKEALLGDDPTGNKKLCTVCPRSSDPFFCKLLYKMGYNFLDTQ